jgi:hypothetical protein
VLSAQNHDVSSTPVIVDRDNITIRGAGADSKGTKLVRGLNYKGALLQIGTLAKSVSGVKIENMTVCGGSKIGHNWIEPENAEGCPRPAGLTLNACERDTRNATLYPKVSPGNCAKDQRACQYPDGTPPAAAFCTDVQVIRSAAASAGSYAVEFTGVQMLDAPGHALSVRGYRNDTDTVKYKTDDIWFRNGAIHRSGITGLLIGSDGKGYTRKFCDSYPNFADSPDIVTPRNIRIENSDFDDNNTGVIGAGTRRVYFGGNRLRRNYIRIFRREARSCSITAAIKSRSSTTRRLSAPAQTIKELRRWNCTVGTRLYRTTCLQVIRIRGLLRSVCWAAAF